MGEEATPRYALPYPGVNGQANLGPKDFQELAERLEAVLPQPGDLRFTEKVTLDAGWLRGEGQQVAIASFKALYESLGGAGNSALTTGAATGMFFVPDYRERVPMGPGTTLKLGAKGGEATHTLSKTEMPPHSHGGSTGGSSTGTAGAHTHAVNAWTSNNPGGGPNIGNAWSVGVGFTNPSFASVNTGIAGTAGDHSHTIPSLSIVTDGSGAAHNNLQPYAVCNVWIKT